MSDKREIKAIFIDAVKEEVREITLKKGGDFKEMYRILTLPWNQTLVDDINVVRVSPPGEREPHYLYVDGEGLLKDPEHFFWWRGFPHPLSGHGLIHRVDEEGESQSCTLDIDEARKKVKFAKLKMHGFVQVIEQREIFGNPGTAITNTAVLTERNSTRTTDDARREIAEHVGVPVEALRWVSLDEAEGLNNEGSEGDDEDQQ